MSQNRVFRKGVHLKHTDAHRLCPFHFAQCSKASQLQAWDGSISAHTMKKDLSFWSRASDVLASSLSLLLCFWNVAANVWTVLSFYQEQNYFSMGVFILLIISSSVLLQTFSWLWYSDSAEELNTSVERFIKRHGLLALVHIVQLGVFLRSVISFCLVFFAGSHGCCSKLQS